MVLVVFILLMVLTIVVMPSLWISLSGGIGMVMAMVIINQVMRVIHALMNLAIPPWRKYMAA